MTKTAPARERRHLWPTFTKQFNFWWQKLPQKFWDPHPLKSNTRQTKQISRNPTIESQDISTLGMSGDPLIPGFLHIFWHVGWHFGDPFWSGRGHFFVIFGKSWEDSGSGLGTFLDICWKVLKKMSDGVPKLKFSKMAGSIFPESGRFRISFLAYPRTKISQKSKISILP